MQEKRLSPRTGSSWVASLSSLALVCSLVAAVIQWHSSATDSFQSTLTHHHRSLLSLKLDDAPNAVTDDATRDDVCKQYLMNFLNGTTDARDECDGMLHAYQAADCSNDQTVAKLLKRRHWHPDGNVTDDDVLIDDFYENWECCSSIYEYYTIHCHEPKLASFRLLGIVSVLVLCGLVKSLLKTFQLEWIPDAGACIAVGAVVGGALKLINPALIDEKLSFFDNDLFLRILLPPIVFQAALTIDKRAFRRDLFPILTFAIFGTFVSAVIVGFMTHWLTLVGGGTTLPLLDSLLFGSLISSIDPVATLAILSGVGVSQTDTLYTLVFGESLLNDGVAIVLFDTLVGHLKDGAVIDRHTLHESLVKFLQMTLGSMGIGIAGGIACTLYFWLLRRKHTAVVEVAIFFCWALIPYYISDGVGYSGIIAIMTMGFFLDYFVLGGGQSEEDQWMDYMEHQNRVLRASRLRCNPLRFTRALFRAFRGQGHLSSRSRNHVGFVAEVIASIFEMAIFAYLGLFLFNDKNVWDVRLNAIAIFGCLISRGMIVVVFGAVINFFMWLDFENRVSRCCSFLLRRGNNGVDNTDDDASSMGSTAHVYLDAKTQQIIFLAGVRGAVSFALVENIPIYDVVRKEGCEFKAELKNMTSCSILFTVFVYGAITQLLIQREKEEVNERGSLLVDGPLAHRLLSAPLLSDDERDEGSSDGLDSGGLEPS